MTPIQQLMLGVGGAKKSYIDDAYSTTVWRGNNTARSINNGLAMTADGGMVWLKCREQNDRQPLIGDTVRGANNTLFTDATSPNSTQTTIITGYTSNGFSIGAGPNYVNENNTKYVSWNFKLTPKFFDCVTFTGNSNTSNTQQIAHSLECKPGLIIVKSTSASQSWKVYHRDRGGTDSLELNTVSSAQTSWAYWNNTEPTSTHFTVGPSSNSDGETYVAYLWAGGESTSSLARSVQFDHGDILTLTTGASLRNWFDQAFTVEYWVKPTHFGSGSGGGSNTVGVSTLGSNNLTWSFGPTQNGTVRFSFYNTSGNESAIVAPTIYKGAWTHLAFVHDGSNNCKIFINGKLETNATISTGAANSGSMAIGKVQSQTFQGSISNLRITHQALYTNSFKVPTEPLTTTSQGASASNVKLLCCNNSSATGATVGGSDFDSATGTPTVKDTDSPFDDVAGFSWGENEDQNVVKCGSYWGNDSSDGPEIYLGWQPSFLIVKRASGGDGDWRIFDDIRGLSGRGATDSFLEANTQDAENSSLNCIDINANGFRPKSSDANWNGINHQYIYFAIRSTDGLVSSPVKVGTSAFNMDGAGSNTPGSNTTPSFDMGIPIDLMLHKQPAATTTQFMLSDRMRGGKFFDLNGNGGGQTNSSIKWDYNDGAGGWTGDMSTYQGWGWKRGAGFDCVMYKANGNAGHQIFHSLGRTPEMIISKRHGNNGNWDVWHHGLNNGSNNLNYRVLLHSTAAESNAGNITAVNSVYWEIGGGNNTNGANDEMMAYLFASTKVSKVGNYTGSNSAVSISTGFSPRFILIKRVSSGGNGNWFVFDTVRGLSSGNDSYLYLNTMAAQDNTYDWVDPTSTGFDLPANNYGLNENNEKYIYYAHA